MVIFLSSSGKSGDGALQVIRRSITINGFAILFLVMKQIKSDGCFIKKKVRQQQKLLLQNN